MKARELELCEIQNWYPRFKSVSLKTIIHPLPEAFIDYLEEDGLFLPRNSEALPARLKGDCEDDDYRHWDEEDDDTDEPDQPSFPDLEEQVMASIAKLDGSVFPKLNWSAPKDSAWISSHGNLKCTNFGEIFLLLKASDSLVHDLSHAFDSCEDKMSHRPQQYVLALRKWYDLRPEMEFRGFVKGGFLVGVSQREVTSFYPAVLESREMLQNAIFQFFVDNISESFELDDYTFDCYVTRAGKVKLIDFNPWVAFTLPLLFSWDELEAIYAKVMTASVASSDADPLFSSGECFNAAGTASIISSSQSCLKPKNLLSSDLHSLKPPNSLHSVKPFGNNSAASRNSVTEASTKDTLIDTSIADDMQNVVSSSQDGASMHRSNSRTDTSADLCAAVEKRNEKRNVCAAHPDFCLPISGRKRSNISLQEQGFKPDFRVVQNSCHVQVNMRVGGGVPYDYVQTGAGSAWDDFLRRAGEESKQQNKDAAAGA